MPDASSLALFTVAAVTLLVIPGPAVLYIVTRSVDQGRAAGLTSVCGVHVGTLVHVAAAALGLSALLVSSATAYDTVRWLGAAYLVWLGVRRLLARDEDLPAAPGPDAHRLGLGRIFAQGVVVNVLNPKTALFFLAFLPQFVDTSRGSVPLQVVVLGVAFVLLGLLSDGAYAMAASTGAGWLRRRPGVARASRLVSGGALISLGVTTALAGSRSSSAQ
ncbi:MAG TPA: LysE family translocator [Actinomycetota bacterium]|nr:LysE family translocator [Actinomycetota bacterium]